MLMRSKLILIFITLIICAIFARIIMGEKAGLILDAPKPYNDTSVAVRGVQAPTPVKPDLQPPQQLDN